MKMVGVQMAERKLVKEIANNQITQWKQLSFDCNEQEMFPYVAVDREARVAHAGANDSEQRKVDPEVDSEEKLSTRPRKTTLG